MNPRSHALLSPAVGITAFMLSIVAPFVACVGDDPAGGASADADSDGSTSTADGSNPGNDGGNIDAGSDAAETCNGTTCKAGFACVDGHCGNEPKSVATGETFACTLLWGGEVYCWGATDKKYVGTPPLATDAQCGARTCRPVPSIIPGFNDVVQIAAGRLHACAVKKNGEVWCWGENGSGQLALGASVADATPTLVQGLPNGTTMVQVTCGERSTCARTASGQLYCWGGNESEQIAQPVATAIFRSPQLVSVSAVTDVRVSFDRNSHEHVCMLNSSKVLSCWGANTNNELGHAGTFGTPPDDDCFGPGACNDVPQAVDNLGSSAPVTSFDVAPAVTCAVQAGEVKCWADNSWYQHARAAPTNSYSAVTIAGLPAPDAGDPIETIGIRGYTSFAITKGGDVWGWGLNDDGYLALDKDGGVACGSASTCRTATKLTAIGKVSVLAAGVSTSLAIRQDGKVIAWGSNTLGMLGHAPDPTGVDNACGGTNPCAIAPVVVPGLP